MERRHRPVGVAGLLVGALLVGSVGAPPAPAAGWTCTSGYVALTFDDGPDPSVAQNTPSIVAILSAYGAHATFFEIGENVRARPAVTKAVVDAGHVVGNHSYTHSRLSQLSTAQVADELTRANDAIVVAGAPAPSLFRPPYGATSDAIRAVAESMSMTETLWSVDSRDYAASSSQAIVRSVTRKLKAGDIVLMHDGWSKYTVGALPAILDFMQSKGLCPGLIERSVTWDPALRGYTRVVPDPNGPHR